MPVSSQMNVNNVNNNDASLVFDSSDYFINKLINNHNLNNIKCIFYENDDIICELGLFDARLYYLLIQILKHVVNKQQEQQEQQQQQQQDRPSPTQDNTRSSNDSGHETIFSNIQDQISINHSDCVEMSSVTSDQTNQISDCGGVGSSELYVNVLDQNDDHKDDHNATKMAAVSVSNVSIGDCNDEITIEVVDEDNELIGKDHEICIQTTNIKQECIEFEDGDHLNCIIIESPENNDNQIQQQQQENASIKWTEEAMALKYNLKPCSIDLRQLTTQEINRLKRQTKSRKKDFYVIPPTREVRRSTRKSKNNTNTESNCIYKPIIKKNTFKSSTPSKKDKSSKKVTKTQKRFSIEEIAINLMEKLIKNNKINQVIQSAT